MGFETIPTSAQNQSFLKNMLWSQTWKPSALFKRLIAGVDKSIQTGDDMKSKVITGDSFYPELADAGATIGASGTLSFAEYTFVKKLIGIPLNMDLRMQTELDAMNNRDAAAATTARWFRSIIDKANDLVEWQFLGDGSGKIADVDSGTAVASGVVTLASTTPRIVFDKLLKYGTYVAVCTHSSGVASPTLTTGGTVYLQGYITANDPVAKTITLGLTYGGATTGYDKVATANLYVFFATPSTVAAQTTAATAWAGIGLATTTTDAITMGTMFGIRKTNEYLTGSYTLHGIGKSAQFNPIYRAGDATKGLVPGLLSEIYNDMNVSAGSDHVIATSNIIWNDWCDDFRTSATTIVDASKEQYNFEPGFMVGGRIKPVHATGYWDALGEVHGIDTSTHHIIYSQMPFLRNAGTDEVGWSFRFNEPLHQNSTYYGAGNQLVFMGNLVSDGRRNQNFKIDSLQTTPLYSA